MLRRGLEVPSGKKGLSIFTNYNLPTKPSTMEEVLNTKNIFRQKYHSKSFVGNHIHKMLQEGCAVTSPLHLCL